MGVGREERGQAAVEAALVMPLLVVFLLGIVQLTVLQQARILTEYAAFSAARAGIVWNGSNERMHDAALVALLPTLGPTLDAQSFGKTWAAAVEHDAALQKLSWGDTPVPESLNGVPLRGAVRVDTVSPSGDISLAEIWNVRGGAQWEELDFDAPDTLSQREGLSAHEAAFEDRSVADSGQSAYRQATVLRIRVRYLYELRIPFANFILFTSWFAQNAGVRLIGPVDRPKLGRPEGKGIGNEEGFATLYPSEMATLWDVATGAQTVGKPGSRRYFIPLSATYSMRMQSNFYRKWLLHGAEEEG